MSDVAVDSSVAVKWVLPESDSPLAEQCGLEVVQSGGRLIVLDFAYAEVANAFAHRKDALRGTLPVSRGTPTDERVRAAMEQAARFKAKADRLEALEVRNLTYHHPGTENGIAGIDLRLRRGDFTVVTGRVGSIGFTRLESGNKYQSG